jgi:hypothetical protein
MLGVSRPAIKLALHYSTFLTRVPRTPNRPESNVTEGSTKWTVTFSHWIKTVPQVSCSSMVQTELLILFTTTAERR